jgi:WD40 repeat protein
MIDMMTNQERTLESMFQAQNSLRKYFQAGDTSLDHDGDTASIFTSTTNATALTAFDFDAVIKSTAVYQRCMKRRDNRKSLLALGSSMMRKTSGSAVNDTPGEAEPDTTSSTKPRIAEENVEWQEFCETGFNGGSTSESVERDDLRIEAPRSILGDLAGSILRSRDAESGSPHMSSPRLLRVPTLAVDTSSRGETSRLLHTDRSIHTNATVEAYKIFEKLGQVVSEQNIAGQDVRRRSSFGHTQEDVLASFAEAFEAKSGIIPGHSPHLSPTLTEILSNCFPTTKDTMSNQISLQTHISRAHRRRSSQDSRVDNELDHGLSVSSSSSSIFSEPGVALDQYNPDSSEMSLQEVSEKHEPLTLSAEVSPTGTNVSKTSISDGDDTRIFGKPLLPSIRTPYWREFGKGAISTGTRLLYDHQEEITNLAISSNLILAAASANTIRLWYLLSGNEIVRIPCRPHSQSNSCLMFSTDGKMLAAAHLLSRNPISTVSVWNSETGSRLCALIIDNGHDNIAIAISQTNRFIACSQKDRRNPRRRTHPTVGLYEIATGRRVGQFPQLETTARMLAFVQADRQLVCVSNGRVEIWDVATYTLIRHWEYTGHTFYRTILTHDLMLVTSNGTKRVDMFHLFSGEKKASVVLSESIRRLACSPGTREIAFAGCNGLVGTWDPTTGIVKKAPESRQTHLYGVAMSQDGQAIVYGGTGGLVRLRYIEDADHGRFDSEEKE